MFTCTYMYMYKYIQSKDNIQVNVQLHIKTEQLENVLQYLHMCELACVKLCAPMSIDFCRS